MVKGTSRRRRVGLAAVVVCCLAGTATMADGATAAPPGSQQEARKASERTLLFVADGMRQDLVARYAGKGVLPGFGDLLKRGAQAGGGGLLTQSPPNTGAGWYSIATGAWPGVHGSTNNTFHVNGAPFANSTSAFGPVLEAETIAQAAERAGKKVAQVEFAGGRSGAINGPTVDFRTFASGRGIATNYTAPGDAAAFVQSLGLHTTTPRASPARPPSPAPPPRRPPGGPTCPPRTARPGRCACASSTSGPTSTASTPTSTTRPTTAAPTTTGCCSPARRRAPTGWPNSAPASGPTSR